MLERFHNEPWLDAVSILWRTPFVAFKFDFTLVVTWLTFASFLGSINLIAIQYFFLKKPFN